MKTSYAEVSHSNKEYMNRNKMNTTDNNHYYEVAKQWCIVS